MSEETESKFTNVLNKATNGIDWIFLRRDLSRVNPNVPNVPYRYTIDTYDFPNVSFEARTDFYNFNLPIKSFEIDFQLGNFHTENTNGILDEFLLAIVQDRLEAFQESEFACVENEKALDHVKNALMWMLARKNNRKAQGVLDTYQKHKS